MDFVKTVDNNKILRIEAEGGSAITVSKKTDAGQILSLYVPEESRRQGVGAVLLHAAEAVLVSEDGIRNLEADYPDELADFTAFLKASDFTVNAEVPIVSISVKELLASPAIRKAMAADAEGTEFIAMEELFVAQLEEIMDNLRSRDIVLEKTDLMHLLQDLSGVVYNKEFAPKAAIFCSEQGEDLNVELLLGSDSADPQYIYAALKGMMKGVVNPEGTVRYRDIIMLALNKNVTGILERLLPEGTKPSQRGMACCASKTIGSDLALPELKEAIDETKAEEWKKETEHVLLLNNIRYKLPWGRKRTAKKTQESDIGYDKGEEEKKGLLSSDTVRITINNLPEFEDVLPPDVRKNMSRPFFHGLAVMGEEYKPKALIVWEMKRAEEEDPEAEIVFFSLGTEKETKTLFEEYSHELAALNAVKSSFETTELSEKDKKALEAAGFSLKQKESRDLIVTLKELAMISTLKKKPAAHAKVLKTISPLDFRRAVTICLYHGKKGLVEDIAFLTKDWFDEDVSSCIIMDNKADGMLLGHETAEGNLFIDLLFSVGVDYRKELVQLIRCSLRAAIVKYGAEKKVVIRRHTNAVLELMLKILPGKKGRDAVYGERSEG